MTIHHTVFWKFNGQQPANFVEQLREKAKGMVGVIPGLTKIEVGPPMPLTKARSQGWEAMLYAELESEDALKAYAPHPAHEEFKKLPEPYKTDIMAFDIEA
ncbi:hypothetical protein JCM10296v2_000914 [Rhodotorula toruloides]